MGLIELLEQTKDIAIEARERSARQSAEDVAAFEDYGGDLAKAFDEEELAAAEEALRLGLQLDDDEEGAMSNRESDDYELARKILADEEQIEAACDKDERLARQLEAELQREMVSVAKLEKRNRELVQRTQCKSDTKLAEELAAEIDAQEQALLREERRDRKLAAQLVKQESKLLKELPQTEEKLKTMARTVNGEEPPTMRTKLVAKLSSMRKSLGSITNTQALAN